MKYCIYYVLATSIVFMSDNIRKKLLCKTGGKKRDVATKLVLGLGSIKRIGNQTGLVLYTDYGRPVR